MRFCMITTFYPPHHFGGDAIFVHRLSHALADRGHDVEVYFNADAYRVLSDDPPVAGYAEHPGVRAVGLRSDLGIFDLLAMHQTGRPYRQRRTLAGLFAPGRFDVIHFHNVSLMGGPAICGTPRVPGTVRLLTVHEHWLVCPMHSLWRNGREPCERQTCFSCQIRGGRPPQLWRLTGHRERSLAGVDAVLAPSRFTRDRHRAFGLGREMRLLPHFAPDLAEATAPVAEEGRPFFLFSGRLEAAKGPQTLVDLFRGLPHVDLVIAGDGGNRDEVVSLAAGAPNVRVVGRLCQRELAGYYRRARAVIVPSLCHEVFGLSAVEAMAAGTPTIVRDRGALPELVDESGAGLKYATDEELRAAVERLLDDATRNDLSRRARQAYEANWTVDRHLERYLRIIAETARPGASAEERAAD